MKIIVSIAKYSKKIFRFAEVLILKIKNMEPKIEKGIPIPKVKTKYAHLFEQMEIGDSFFVDVKKSNLNSNAHFYKNKKNNSFNYIVKEENNGARIWRVK